MSKNKKEKLDSEEPFPEQGFDGNSFYISGKDFWQTIIIDDWYENELDYWSSQPANDEGMLGGNPEVSKLDCRTNLKFFQDLFETKILENSRCLDCGAGVGRVAKHCLSKFFPCVDIAELNYDYIERATETYGKENWFGNCFECSLHELSIPQERKYDCIFHSWVLDHITDEDLKSYLKRMANALTPKGFVVLKENTSSERLFIADFKDSTFIRTKSYWDNLISEAGLEIVKEQLQVGFPDDFYPVWMIALRLKS